MKSENPLIHRIPVKDSNGKVIGEKEVVAYRGLLDMAHKERLSVVKTELLQAPTKDNGETAIVSAEVKTSRGTFMGIGDANPRNVNAKVAPHLIRMAETRAEARALRKAVNIGTVALEELGDDLSDDLTYEGALKPTGGSGGGGPPSAPAQNGQGNGSGHAGDGNGHTSNDNGQRNGYSGSADGNRVTDSQRRFLFRLLAERDIRGDEAREYIHQTLGVASLEDATKHAVSALIDSLKNAENGARPEPGHRG